LVLPLGGNTKQRSSVPISICASQPWGRANSPLSGSPGGGVVSFPSLWVFGLSPENNIFLRRGGQAHCGRAVFPLCCGARAEAKQNLFFVIGAGDWGGSQFNNAQRTVWFVCSLWGVLCKTTHNFAGGQRKQKGDDPDEMVLNDPSSRTDLPRSSQWLVFQPVEALFCVRILPMVNGL
jgi:hypothetical protein